MPPRILRDGIELARSRVECRLTRTRLVCQRATKHRERVRKMNRPSRAQERMRSPSHEMKSSDHARCRAIEWLAPTQLVALVRPRGSDLVSPPATNSESRRGDESPRRARLADHLPAKDSRPTP